MTATIHRGDLLEHMRGNEWLVQHGYIPKAHAVLCDPPYFLGGMSKRWSAATKDNYHASPFNRTHKGFMGQKWDGFSNMYEYQAWCEEWGRLLLSFVYPGAVMLAFGGTRTYHRLAAGLEDAGWIVGDSLIWTYSSGFPKSHSISKAIDRAEGAERTKAEWYDKYHDGITRTEQDLGVSHVGFSTNRAANTNIRSLPATPAAIQWDGWGTALSPAYEPILLCRAPWSGTYAGIAQEHGTGAINVDGGRIGAGEEIPTFHATSAHRFEDYSVTVKRTGETRSNGRWPKNLLLSCACESDEHDAGCPVRIMGEQSGETTSGARTGQIQKPGNHGIYGTFEGKPGFSEGSTGTAARMFYQAKASKWEREAGLHKRKALPPANVYGAGLNTATKIRTDEQAQIGVNRDARRNSHPTVKPIQLNTYLARLILPPPLSEPRRLLVPFCGSGSEMIGATLAGWDDVIGFEQSDEYAAIAEARIAWWAQFADYEQAKRAWDADNVEAQQRTAELAAGVLQLAMFEESGT